MLITAAGERPMSIQVRPPADASAFDSLAGWLECEADQHEAHACAVVGLGDPPGTPASDGIATDLRRAARLVRDLAARMPDATAAPIEWQSVRAAVAARRGDQD
jgi:hypothetical protein